MKVKIALAIIFCTLFSVITLAESKFALAQVAIPVTPVTPVTSPTPTPATPPVPATPPTPVTPPAPVTPPVVQNSTITGWVIYELIDLKSDKATSVRAANVTIEATNLFTREVHFASTDQFGNFSIPAKSGNLYFLRAKDGQNTRFTPNFRLVYANGYVNNVAFSATKTIQPQNYQVTGKVQYASFNWRAWRWSAQPASGSTIQFTNTQTGKTTKTVVDLNGNYSARLEAGKYQIRPYGKAFFLGRAITVDKPVSLNFQGYLL